jgi:ELWxxDGT repeat protein
MRKRGAYSIEALEPRRMLAGGTISTFQLELTPEQSALIGDSLYFTVPDPSYLTGSLWCGDGTPAGSVQVTNANGGDLTIGAVAFRPAAEHMIVFDHPLPDYSGDPYPPPIRFLLRAVKTGGTRARFLGEFDVPAREFGEAAVAGVVYFVASKPASPWDPINLNLLQLWRTDGTVAGTFPLTNIEQSDLGYDRYHLVPAGDQLYFSVDTLSNGTELYATNGTPSGTHKVPGIVTAKNGTNLNLGNITALGNRVFFTTWVDDKFEDGVNLYSTDGTAGGTTLLGHGDSIKRLASGRYLYFDSLRKDVDSLWRSDGTAAGTIKLFDAPQSQFVQDFHTFNGDLYFRVDTGTLYEGLGGPRMVSDGTIGGTREGKPAFDLDFEFILTWPVPAGNLFAFTAQGHDFSRNSQPALYLTDGTRSGTRGASPCSSGDVAFAVAKSKIYFSVSDPDYHRRFGTYTPSPQIAGTVFDDVNANGVRDAGEPPLRGYKIFIDRNNDGRCNPSEIWTRASSTGRYTFSFLAPRVYTIRIVGVTGRRASTPERYRVAVTSDGAVTRYFGRTEKVIVGGLVYIDVNQNGTIDHGESGISSWAVFIDADSDGVLGTGETSTLTDAAGRFAFGPLNPGTYRTRVVPRSGYHLIAPGAGYRNLTLSAGGVNLSVNFGENRLQ